MASSSARREPTSLQPDAPATKRDLNEMAEAIVTDVRGQFGEVRGRFGEVRGQIDKMERLLRLVAIRVGIPEPEVDEVLR